MEQTMAKDLTQGSVLRQLMLFALPIALANILQIVYTVVDTIMIGRFIGTAGISAVTSAGNIMMIFTNFSMGVSGAGQVIIAQFQGKGDKVSVSRSVGTMFTFVILLALILMAAAIPCTNPLLRLIRTPDEAFRMASDYAICCFSGMVFIFGYSGVGAMLRGMGDSRHPLVFIAIATVTNIVLDLVFIGLLDMSTFGAALATVIGQGISFLFSLAYLYRKREAFGFDFRPRSFRMDPMILKMLMRLGLPMALQHITVNISVMYVAACINTYGVVISALTGIGDKLRIILAILVSSVGTAASAMIGQNVGAGKYDRVKRIYLITMLVLLVPCALLGGIGALFPRTVVGVFDRSPEVLAMAPRFMVINLVTYMAFAFYQPFTSLINGLGYAAFAFINGIIDGVVARIGIAWLMHSVLQRGYWGIWWGASLATYVCATIGTIYFLSGRWRTRKPITGRADGA